MDTSPEGKDGQVIAASESRLRTCNSATHIGTERLVNVGDNTPRHELLVSLPVLAIPTNGQISYWCPMIEKDCILLRTLLVVASLAMNEEDSEVGYIEVGNGGFEACRK